jgi:hypothetical protein
MLLYKKTKVKRPQERNTARPQDCKTARQTNKNEQQATRVISYICNSDYLTYEFC